MKLRSLKLAAAAMTALAGFACRVDAAAFTPGDLAIYRVGTGTGALSGAAANVFIDEYTTSGTFVQSIAMPTVGVGSNKRLTADAVSKSEGMLALSGDGKYLTLMGYDATPGTLGNPGVNGLNTEVSQSTAANTARVVGILDAAGNVDTSTALGDSYSTNNPRGAITPGGSSISAITTIYTSGNGSGSGVSANGGVRLTTLGSSTASLLSTTNVNTRNLDLVKLDGVNDSLIVSSGSGSPRMGRMTPPPTSGNSNVITALPGFPTTAVTYMEYFFADLTDSVAGMDTMYVVDQSGTSIAKLRKYSLVGGSWTENTVIGSPDNWIEIGNASRGLTGVDQGTTATIFVTETDDTFTTSMLKRYVDSTGYNTALNPADYTTLATASANTAFFGIALTPTPEPASLGFLALGGLLALRRRSR